MRPRVALVPYTSGWSYDLTAIALRRHLADRFEISIFHRSDLDRIRPSELDLVLDLLWKGQLSRRFGPRVLKQVSSHRWAQDRHGGLTAERFIRRELFSVGGVIVPSRRLAVELEGAPHVSIGPKGFHPETFFDRGERRGPLVVGWAGAATAADKNVATLVEAEPGIHLADRCLTQGEMPDFYAGLDVIACASDAEGDPRPVIEAMACGCFVVSVDVGIVPELVRHGENGIIVGRSAAAFVDAFAWCRANVDRVRAAGRTNAEEMLRTRTWAIAARPWGDAFAAAIERAPPWKVNARMERVARYLATARRR